MYRTAFQAPFSNKKQIDLHFGLFSEKGQKTHKNILKKGEKSYFVKTERRLGVHAEAKPLEREEIAKAALKKSTSKASLQVT